jgi:hypothetical protein
MAASATTCPYANEGKCEMESFVRGDDFATICRTHVCRGQTGCPNTMLPEGRGAPYCAREECAAWGENPLGNAPGLNYDVMLKIVPYMDEQELVYLRDASWEMRLVVDRIYRLRNRDVLRLAKTWYGAARSAERMREAIKEREPSPRAFFASLMHPTADVMHVVLSAGWPVKSAVVNNMAFLIMQSISVAILDYLMRNHQERPEFESFGSADTVAGYAAKLNRADMLQYLTEGHGWTPQAPGNMFYEAVLNQKLEVAEWLRTRGAPVDERPQNAALDICAVYYVARNPEYVGSRRILEWMHYGVGVDRMPCHGECGWYRTHPEP